MRRHLRGGETASTNETQPPVQTRVMEIIFVLLPISLALAIIAAIAFIWSTKRGQYDDLETPAMRMLFDEPEVCREGKPQRENTGELTREEKLISGN